ncbi:Intradiol ring-cleavage dioxygenase [Desarmillaria ectypa]|nr:Intradiol ring-cleavage dioxygenase [Desarmillaria ectypa]
MPTAAPAALAVTVAHYYILKACVALSYISSTTAHPHKEKSIPEDWVTVQISLRNAPSKPPAAQIKDTKLAARNWDSRGLEERAKYAEIQNDTCLLSPDTIFGPYFVDGPSLFWYPTVLPDSFYRGVASSDVREGQEGIDIYLDIGLINADTCEPTSGVYIDFWHCNASGIYSGYTGIDPDTVEAYEGNSFNGSLINEVCAMDPYTAHLSTLDWADSIYSVANADSYNFVISAQLLGSTLANGIVGYITVGVNVSETFDTSNSNPIGVIPIVSLSAGAEASASALDAAESLTV